MQHTDAATIVAEMGRQLNEAAEQWRVATYAQHEGCAIREAMQRPNLAAGRPLGRYVALALNAAGLVVAALVSEFDTRTLHLVTTAKQLPQPQEAETMPEPFRTLATSRGSGFIQISARPFDGYEAQDEREGL